MAGEPGEVPPRDASADARPPVTLEAAGEPEAAAARAALGRLCLDGNSDGMNVGGSPGVSLAVPV